jgi:hypothetical protein
VARAETLFVRRRDALASSALIAFLDCASRDGADQVDAVSGPARDKACGPGDGGGFRGGNAPLPRRSARGASHRA